MRHLLIDLHNTLVCPFMMDEVSKPAKWFTRANLEVDEPSWHLAFDRRSKQYVDPDSCTDKQFCRRKPWYWYAFRLPASSGPRLGLGLGFGLGFRFGFGFGFGLGSPGRYRLLTRPKP